MGLVLEVIEKIFVTELNCLNTRLCIFVDSLIKRIGQDPLEIEVCIVYKCRHCAFFVTLTMVMRIFLSSVHLALKA